MCSIEEFIWASDLLASGLFESAEVQRKAEEAIQKFKKDPNVLQRCRDAIESENIPSHAYLFYTFNVLKDAIVSHWTTLSLPEVHNWLEVILHFAAHNAEKLPSYVTQQLCNTLAVIVKRSTIAADPWSKSKLIESVFQLMKSETCALRILAFSIADALISEFADIYNSNLQVTSQALKLSKIEFQSKDLPQIFQILIQVLKDAFCDDVNLKTNSEVGLFAKRSLSLLEQILSWNFLMANRYQMSEVRESFKPGLEWKQIVLASDAVEFILSFGLNIPHNEELCNHWLRCVVLLSSLNGTIFSNSSEQVGYLLKFTDFLTTKLLLNEKLSFNHAFEVSATVNKLCVNFDKNVWLQLPSSVLVSFFEKLCSFSSKVCQFLCSEESQNDDHVFRDAYQLLLNSWVIHVSDNGFAQNNSQITEYCFTLFSFYVQCHLAQPDGLRNEILDSEIDETEESDRKLFVDQLNSVAILGRNCLEKSLPLMKALLDHTVSKLLHCLTVDRNSNVDQIFEDLHWVILISSHLIADETEGETPAIPYEILDLSLRMCDSVTHDSIVLHNLFVDYATASKSGHSFDAVIHLVAAVFNYLCFEERFLHADMSSVLSPEVSCDLLSILTRLSESYVLYRNDALSIDVSPSIRIIFGEESGGGNWMAEKLLNKVLLNILKYNSEPTVVEESLNLLLSLVQHNREAVLKCEVMNQIIDLIANHDQFWSSLSADCCRILMQSLLIAVQKKPEMTQLLLNNLLLHNFEACMLRNSQKKRADTQFDVLRELGLVLDLTKGAVRACHVENTDLIFGASFKVVSQFSQIILSNIYSEEIVACQLDIMYDLTSVAINFLTSNQLKMLLDVICSFMETLKSQGILKMKSGTSAKEDDSIISRYESILGIVLNVASIESIDVFGTFNPEDSARAAFQMLNTILPSMNAELLKVPQISEVYFDLIATLFEFNSSRILENLTSEVFQFVMLTLNDALQFGNQSESNQALKSISFLAQFGSSLSQNSGVSSSVIVSTCKHFIRTIFKCLINHSISNENIEASSNAVFNLILLLPGDVNEIFAAVLANLIADDPAANEKVVQAFANLTAPIVNTGSRGDVKRTGTIFKNRLEKFLDVLGGLVIV